MKVQKDHNAEFYGDLTRLLQDARAARREYIGGILRSAWSATIRIVRFASRIVTPRALKTRGGMSAHSQLGN